MLRQQIPLHAPFDTDFLPVASGRDLFFTSVFYLQGRKSRSSPSRTRAGCRGALNGTDRVREGAMQNTKTLGNAVFGKAALAAAALGGLFFLVGAPAAKAEDCAKRIRKIEHKLGEAIEDHGYYSRQAEHWRHERQEAYESCNRYGYDRDRDGGWYDRDGRYHDRWGGWYDRDGRYHDADDYRRDHDRD